MAEEKLPQREEAQEPEERHDDLDLPEETAEQVKGGAAGWKTPQKDAGQKL